VKTLSEDLIWIRETLEGNPKAFGNIVLKYQDRFIAMGMRILRSREEAEDALEEAFIDAYRHLADFQNRARFSTWLYSIVINHIRNRLRHNRVLRWVPLEGVSNDDDFRPMDYAESGPSMDTVLDHKLQLEAVYEAAKHLSLKYQSIFTMHYFKGMSLQQVADQLGSPLGTVKAYLHHARAFLVKRLGKTPYLASK
jgi:RNA polymerase sigma-70 factor (ECF subfamily)